MGGWEETGGEEIGAVVVVRRLRGGTVWDDPAAERRHGGFGWHGGMGTCGLAPAGWRGVRRGPSLTSRKLHKNAGPGIQGNSKASGQGNVLQSTKKSCLVQEIPHDWHILLPLCL